MSGRASRAMGEAVLILALFAGPLAFGAVEPWSEALIIVLAAAAALLALGGGRSAFTACQVCVLGGLAALAGLAVLQWLNAADPLGPCPSWPHTVCRPDTLRTAVRLAGCAAVAWASAQSTADKSGLTRLAWAIFALGALIALIGLLQLADGNSRLYGVRWYQSRVNPFGPYYNRNHAAALLGLALFSGFGVFLDRLKGHRARAESSAADFAASQFMILGLIGLILAGLFATGSRAALGTVGIVLIVGGIGYRRRLTFVGAVASVAIAGVYLMNAAKGGLVSSLGQRAAIYASTWTMIVDAPFFGRGLGAYARSMSAYQTNGLDGMVFQAHSDPLQLLADGGLAAAIVVMAAGIFFIRRIEPPFRDPLRAALAAGAVAFALHSFVEFNADILGNLFIFVAVLAALGAGEQARRSPLSRPVSRLAAVGFVLVIGWSVGRAAAWTIVAQVAEESADRFQAAQWASSLDGDPSYLRQAAFASQKSGGREAWLAAEAALRAWPLDSRALELAGRALSSLGRAADGAELRARALKVFHG